MGVKTAGIKKALSAILHAGPGRIWELDALRGVAVIAMAVYHAFFTAHYIGLSSIDPYTGFLGVFPLFIAGSFLFISGLSLRLSYERRPSPRSILRRSALLALCGLLISLVTFLAAGWESFVAFGVLHCLALSGIICLPLLGRRYLPLLLGLALVILGFIFLHGRDFPLWTWWIFILGTRPQNYYPIDFVPLIPWCGFSFLGVFAASFLYKGGTRAYPLAFSGASPLFRALSFLGRASLPIYVVHIPLIFGVLFLIKLALGL